jgi:hypothetical protein
MYGIVHRYATFDRRELAGGEAVALTFTLTDGGQPATDLVPWLGAAAIVAIGSVDGMAFARAHGTPADSIGDHDSHTRRDGQADHGEYTGRAPAAHEPAGPVGRTFEAPGLYKVWAQFSRDGRVLTVACVVEVV